MFSHRRILTILLPLLIASPPFPARAAAEPPRAKRLDVVVFPLLDGDRDEESRELSRALQRDLAEDPRYHLVDAATMRDLLSYHDYRAETSSDEIDLLRQRLERAREHYFQFAYEEALALLDQCLSEAAAFSLGRPMGELLWEARITRGVVAKAAGHDAKARSDFAAALRIHPTATLDEHAFAPSIVALFAEERRKMLAEPRGAIDVQSDPAVAEVYLNGNYQGVTPLLLKELPHGEYVVELQTNRYRPVGETVVVADGATAIVAHKLAFERRQKGAARPLILQGDPRAEVDFGLHLADVAKVDRVILVKVGDADDGRMTLKGRVIDRRFRTGLFPSVVPVDAAQGDKSRQRFHHEIRAALAEDLAERRAAIDPAGKGTVALLGASRQRRTAHEKIVWGSFGLPTLGALAGGIAAAFSSEEAPPAGSLRVTFR